MKKLLVLVVLLVSGLGLTSCSSEPIEETHEQETNKYYMEMESYHSDKDFTMTAFVLDNKNTITKLTLSGQSHNDCFFETNTKSINVIVNGLIYKMNDCYITIYKIKNGEKIRLFGQYFTQKNSSKIISLE